MKKRKNSFPAFELHPDALPYRAWAVMVTHDPGIFSQVVARAVAQAKRYHINRIEFHDFLYEFPAPEGFVDNVVRFDNFPELRGT
ncbi:MAG: hypothetical protein Q8O57_10230, partial [Kiritimatiellota bacterium]|nr:hypothetical protein [Kiritimatiellota bacterium]